MNESIEKAGAWVKLVIGLQALWKQIWKYLALIFAGVIAGLVYAMKQVKPVQNIQAEEFINEQSRDLKVGKIKQKGENLSLEIELTGKEKRVARRTARRKKREQKDLTKIQTP